MLASLLRKKKKSISCGFNRLFQKSKSPRSRTCDAENEFDKSVKNIDIRYAMELKQFWDCCSTIGDEEIPDYDNLKEILHIMYWNINSSLMPTEVLHDSCAPKSQHSTESTLSSRREIVLNMREKVFSRFLQVDITPWKFTWVNIFYSLRMRFKIHIILWTGCSIERIHWPTSTYDSHNSWFSFLVIVWIS